MAFFFPQAHLEEDREEGKQEGKYEGRQEAIREMLFDLLQARFGELTLFFKEQINQIEDMNRLKILHREAVTVKSLAVFAQFLTNN